MRRDALSESDLRQMIANIPATRKLLLLDTCNMYSQQTSSTTKQLTDSELENTPLS